MRKRVGLKKRGKKLAGANEELHAPVILKKNKGDKDANKDKKPEKGNGAFYKAGPAMAMPDISDEVGAGLKNGKGLKKMLSGGGDKDLEPSPLPVATGKGSEKKATGESTNVVLDGLTEAQFDGGAFRTANVRLSTAEGCTGCNEGDPCVRVRGTLVATYKVTTTVTLPSVDDFPELTPCQRTRVQTAIDTVLAPHEQDHVSAFKQYNGVVRTPFDLTICRGDFNSEIQTMFDDQESARQSSAQGASDALDPFNVDLDLNCEEPTDDAAEEESSSSDLGAGVEPSTSEPGATVEN